MINFFLLYVLILGNLQPRWAQIILVHSLGDCSCCPTYQVTYFPGWAYQNQYMLFTLRIIIHSKKPGIWYKLRMIFKMIKLLSVHIVRYQFSWSQLVFKTTTSNTKEVSNAQRTSKRGRGRRTTKGRKANHNAKVLHCTSTGSMYTCTIICGQKGCDTLWVCVFHVSSFSLLTTNYAVLPFVCQTGS